ncbi:Membrane-associated tyrosine- and threonine-specific cdc2-inhibitory kinase [Trichoplax sp. H2]|nr:Membrane-associated tyrosine- and threonine-specific cdc2-inhibitory kinase [Trichoplax sp. H2]|eukprot:RDD44669.1 Membrane-associated tyrosine- and threonine-specific cdc2-inhibitory kinase [Trichoplax sp. H2]
MPISVWSIQQRKKMEKNNLPSSPVRIIPMPTFYDNSQSLRKKSRQSYQLPPPKPPAKTVPPISRVFRHRQTDLRAHSVSFKGQSYENTSAVVNSPIYNKNTNRSYFEQCFDIEKQLGSGSFGEVFQVKNKEDGQSYAVKVSREKFRNNADRQVKAIYSNRTLRNEGLKHLHDFGSVHMDIKPANIFVSKDLVCKLGDFGLVLSLTDMNESDCQEGDSKYLAPEVLQGSFGKPADIFSVGITTFELACDVELPSRGEGWHQLRSGELPEEFTKDISSGLKLLIMSMIDPIPDKRITVDQLLAHEYLKQLRNERLHNQNSHGHRLELRLEGVKAMDEIDDKPISSTPQTEKPNSIGNSYLYDKDISDDESLSDNCKSLRLNPFTSLKRSLDDEWDNDDISSSPAKLNFNARTDITPANLPFPNPSVGDLSCRLNFDHVLESAPTPNQRSKVKERSYTPHSVGNKNLKERFQCVVEPKNLLEVFEDVAISDRR